MRKRIAVIPTLVLAHTLLCATGHADFTNEGKGWSVVIGEDGLLHSLRVGSTEMLQPFPNRNSPQIIIPRSTQQPINWIYHLARSEQIVRLKLLPLRAV